MDKFPGVGPDIADGYARRTIQIPQTSQPLASEHRIDRRARLAHQRRQAVRAPAQAETEHTDLLHLLRRRQPRRGLRARGAVLQSSRSSLPPAVEPLVRCGAGDPQRACSLTHQPPQVHDPLHQQQTSEGSKLGIPMSHGGPPEWSRITPSHFTLARQPSVNNLFGNYT